MAWRIGEILVQKKLISWNQLEEVLEEQKQTREFTGEILIRKGYVSSLLFYKSLAEQHKLRFIDLKRTRVNPKAVELIPRSVAQKYSLMPVEILQGELVIGISNPLMVWPEAELKELTKMPAIRTVLCLPADIQKAIQEYYGREETAAQEVLR